MFILSREEAIMAALNGKKVKHKNEEDCLAFTFDAAVTGQFFYCPSGRIKTVFSEGPYILVEEPVPFYKAAETSIKEQKVMISAVSGHAFCLAKGNGDRISLTLEEILGPWVIRDSILL